MTLLTALACPFPYGYAGVEYLFVMPRSQQYLLKALLSNCSPLSEMRVRGILNRTTIFFPNKSLCIRIPDICQWFSFNPLGEVIRADQQISFIPCYIRERTYNVQAPFSKRPRAGQRIKDSSELMNVWCKSLALVTLLHILLYFLLHIWLPIALSEGPVRQRFAPRVASTNPFM